MRVIVFNLGGYGVREVCYFSVIIWVRGGCEIDFFIKVVFKVWGY